MFRNLYFLYFIASITAIAMNPTQKSTAVEKALFFADNGWESAGTLVYPGEHLGDLDLMQICAGGQQCGQLPNAFNDLGTIAHLFIDAVGLEKIRRDGTVMVEANFGMIERQLPTKPTASLKTLYKRLIDNTATSHLVITTRSEPESRFNDAIYLAPAGNRGWGAFANRKLSAGDVLVEYVGQVWLYDYHLNSSLKYRFVCRKPGLEVTESLRRFPNTKDSVYTANLLSRDPQLILMDHPTSTAETELGIIIDALKVRNEAAFLNHSRFGNADYTRALKVTLSQNDEGKFYIARLEYSIYLFAKNNIEKDEELLWDYKLQAGIIESLRPVGIFLSDYSPKNVCYTCGKDKQSDGRSLSMCKKCQTAQYCSRECQVKDWKVHKMYCFEPKDSAPDKSSASVDAITARFGS